MFILVCFWFSVLTVSTRGKSRGAIGEPQWYYTLWGVCSHASFDVRSNGSFFLFSHSSSWCWCASNGVKGTHKCYCHSLCIARGHCLILVNDMGVFVSGCVCPILWWSGLVYRRFIIHVRNRTSKWSWGSDACFCFNLHCRVHRFTLAIWVEDFKLTFDLTRVYCHMVCIHFQEAGTMIVIEEICQKWVFFLPSSSFITI